MRDWVAMLSALTLPVGLAACGKAAPPEGNGFAVEQGGGQAHPPAPGVPVETQPRISDIRRAARTFPTAFQGRWGLTTADCDISRINDARGLMRIEEGTVRFYEADATATAMPTKTPYELTADLVFRHGSTTWQRRERFALQTGGIALLRTEPSVNGGSGRTFRYERC